MHGGEEYSGSENGNIEHKSIIDIIFLHSWLSGATEVYFSYILNFKTERFVRIAMSAGRLAEWTKAN